MVCTVNPRDAAVGTPKEHWRSQWHTGGLAMIRQMAPFRQGNIESRSGKRRRKSENLRRRYQVG